MAMHDELVRRTCTVCLLLHKLGGDFGKGLGVLNGKQPAHLGLIAAVPRVVAERDELRLRRRDHAAAKRHVALVVCRVAPKREWSREREPCRWRKHVRSNIADLRHCCPYRRMATATLATR